MDEHSHPPPEISLKGQTEKASIRFYEILQPKTAKVMASFANTTENSPAITDNNYGKGHAIYVAVPAQISIPWAAYAPTPLSLAVLNALKKEAEDRNSNHLAMDELARATGGKASYNQNGLNETLAEDIDNGLAVKPEQYKMVQKSGIPFHLDIDAPRGDIYLRTGIFDAVVHQSGHTGDSLSAVKRSYL